MTARVLVVEDEAIVSEDIRDMLVSMGYAPVGPHATSEAALAAARAQPVDLALMDIHLAGDADGIEAAGVLAKEGVAVVFLTAFADDATLARAKLATPHGYVVKPFDRRDLRTAIEVALYKRDVEARLERHRRLLASVLAGVAEGIVALDAAGGVTLVNPQAGALLGVAPEDAHGRPLRDVARIVDASRAPLEAALEKAVSRGRVHVVERARIERADAQEVVVDCLLSPLPDAAGRPAGAVLVLRSPSAASAVREADATARRDRLMERIRDLV